MRILSSSVSGHDSGISFLDDGVLKEVIVSERVTRVKHAGTILNDTFVDVLQETDPDVCSFCFLNVVDFIKNKCFELKDIAESRDIRTTITDDDHHLCHAYSGFYTSSFDDALCIVMDGNGSIIGFNDLEVWETESVYVFEKGLLKDTVLKNYSLRQNFYDSKELNYEIFRDDKTVVTTETSVGQQFDKACRLMGMNWHDAGKLMGLSQYKNHKDKLPDGYNDPDWMNKVDYAHKIQREGERRILELVKKYVNQTGIKNVVLSGGVFLNCVSNYNLVKQIDDINIHVDPMCSDNGIPVGKSLLTYVEETGRQPKRIENCYLGHLESNYDLEKYNINYRTNVSYEDVVDILLGGEVVSFFQGRSEVGQRSLGNRSLLFDPRVKNGKTIVNKIKRREDYRPFAASILVECAKDWFDMRGLDESPTMSFAIDAFQNAVDCVPSVIHVDNTSRIQTVSKKQNYHFYNLINEFYKKTGVPMLLNTSFNLAGEPLVETLDDAIRTLELSELKYLFLPEMNFLIVKD